MARLFFGDAKKSNSAAGPKPGLSPEHNTANPTNTLTPHSYALTPHSYALTPHSYALTPHSYALTPHSYDLTPHSYALTPHPSLLNPPKIPHRSQMPRLDMRVAAYLLRQAGEGNGLGAVVQGQVGEQRSDGVAVFGD